MRRQGAKSLLKFGGKRLCTGIDCSKSAICEGQSREGSPCWNNSKSELVLKDFYSGTGSHQYFRQVARRRAALAKKEPCIDTPAGCTDTDIGLRSRSTACQVSSSASFPIRQDEKDSGLTCQKQGASGVDPQNK
jgi:hypothetical protein